MLSEFRLPALGADMEEGTVVQWNVAPGDAVSAARSSRWSSPRRARSMSRSSRTEWCASSSCRRAQGARRNRSCAARYNWPVGASLTGAWIRGRCAGDCGSRARISPAARVRARELGVEVGSLSGTGPGGAITIEDVEKAKRPAQPPRQPPGAKAGERGMGSPEACVKRSRPRCRVPSANPAPLSFAHKGRHRGGRLAGGAQCICARHGADALHRAAHQGGRADVSRRPGIQRLLQRRSLRAEPVGARRRSGGTARRRSRGTRDHGHGRQAAAGVDGRVSPARHAGARGTAARKRTRSPEHHRHEPRRRGCGCSLPDHPASTGRDRRLRSRQLASVGS